MSRVQRIRAAYDTVLTATSEPQSPGVVAAMCAGGAIAIFVLVTVIDNPPRR